MAVGGPLFGSSSGGRSQAKSSLVEFRAGKMTFNATTKMVSPDKRKGMLMVTQSDDQLMHLQWKDRTSGTVEDDLILMPDDVEFKAVPACTTGRVFVLKFKGNDKKMFFWMQEPKTDKDEEYCKKVNDFLNNPPPPGSSRSGGGGGGSGGLPGNLDFNNLGDSELQSLLSNMDQRQLMQLFGGSLGGGGSNMSSLGSLLSGGGTGGRSRQAAGSGNTRQRNPADVQNPPSATGGGDRASSTPATVPVPAPAPGGAGANPAIQLSDLQSILSNMQVPAGEPVAGGGLAVDLATGITGEALQPLLQNQEFLDKVKDFLPAGEEGKEVTLTDLSGTVQSPQFQQSLSMFSMALSSGQLGPLIREFGLGDEAAAAAAQGDMEAFVKALQNKGDKKDDKDKEEDMALD